MPLSGEHPSSLCAYVASVVRASNWILYLYPVAVGLMFCNIMLEKLTELPQHIDHLVPLFEMCVSS